MIFFGGKNWARGQSQQNISDLLLFQSTQGCPQAPTAHPEHPPLPAQPLSTAGTKFQELDLTILPSQDILRS